MHDREEIAKDLDISVPPPFLGPHPHTPTAREEESSTSEGEGGRKKPLQPPLDLSEVKLKDGVLFFSTEVTYFSNAFIHVLYMPAQS